LFQVLLQITPRTERKEVLPQHRRVTSSVLLNTSTNHILTLIVGYSLATRTGISWRFSRQTGR